MTDHTMPTAPPRAAAGHSQDDRRAGGVAVRSLAEAAGTFLVILAGVGATITVSDTALQPTLVFGFAVVAAMIAFGYVSGGHFNPAITIGSVMAGRTAMRDGAAYVVAQVVGASAATALTWLVLSANPQLTDISNFFSAASNGFDENSPIRFPLASAFLLEVVATALLVAVFLGATSRRARRDLAPFAVGLTYTGLLTFLLPVTNGGLNPARSTASAIFAEPWAIQQLWLFWAAPVVGALIAGLVYRSVESSTGASSAGSSFGDGTDVDVDAASDTRSGSSRDGRSAAAGRRTDRPAGDDAASFFGGSSGPRTDDDAVDEAGDQGGDHGAAGGHDGPRR